MRIKSWRHVYPIIGLPPAAFGPGGTREGSLQNIPHLRLISRLALVGGECVLDDLKLNGTKFAISQLFLSRALKFVVPSSLMGILSFQFSPCGDCFNCLPFLSGVTSARQGMTSGDLAVQTV